MIEWVYDVNVCHDRCLRRSVRAPLILSLRLRSDACRHDLNSHLPSARWLQIHIPRY